MATKYVKPVAGSNIVSDCSVAVNGGLLINLVVEVPSTGGTAIAANSKAFDVIALGVTGDGDMVERVPGSATGYTNATITDDDGAISVKSVLGVTAGTKMAFRGFLAMN